MTHVGVEHPYPSEPKRPDLPMEAYPAEGTMLLSSSFSVR